MLASAVAELSFASTVVFSTILISLHFLKPEFDPSWRMISEYEIGRHGWLMRTAFFFWSISCFALATALWQQTSTLGILLLILAGIGPLGAAFFAPDPITTPRDGKTLHDRLHSMFGVTFIFGFPIAVTVVDWSSTMLSGWLPWASLMVWAGVFVFGASLYYFVMKHRALGPKALIGWPNRFMAFTYVAWLMIVALALF